VNHYDCLKVTSDAPTEVIRAAYRALAGKRHPDRQGGSMGRDDRMHEQMVAINAAYEVLINPDLRVQYDAMLAAKTKPSSSNGNGSGKLLEVAEPENGFSETRVDIDWITPKIAGPAPLWPLSPNRRYVALAFSMLLLLSVVWVVWDAVVRHQMDKALSDQYTTFPAARTLDEDQLEALADAEASSASAAPAPARSTKADMTSEEAMAEEQGVPASRPQTPPASFDRPPTVTELSRLSDEQLMAILPSLGELQPAKGSFSRQVTTPHHPLDGKPLNLRQDRQLVDPLALDMLKH
jgi:curved DNA-binding protein CbpA